MIVAAVVFVVAADAVVVVAVAAVATGLLMCDRCRMRWWSGK